MVSNLLSLSFSLSALIKQPSLARGIGQVFRYGDHLGWDDMWMGRGANGVLISFMGCSQQERRYIFNLYIPYTYTYSNSSSICAELFFLPFSSMYCI